MSIPIIRDAFAGAITVNSAEGSYKWFTADLPKGAIYYVEECKMQGQTTVAAGTTNILTWKLKDEDDNTICYLAGSTAVAITGTAFGNYSATYRRIDASTEAHKLYFTYACSGEGQSTAVNVHFWLRLTAIRPGVSNLVSETYEN